MKARGLRARIFRLFALQVLIISVATLLGILQPLLIIVMGAIVLTIVLAIYDG